MTRNRSVSPPVTAIRCAHGLLNPYFLLTLLPHSPRRASGRSVLTWGGCTLAEPTTPRTCAGPDVAPFIRRGGYRRGCPLVHRAQLAESFARSASPRQRPACTHTPADPISSRNTRARPRSRNRHGADGRRRRASAAQGFSRRPVPFAAFDGRRGCPRRQEDR